MANSSGWRGTLHFAPARRGTGAVERLWLRWTGPLGLGARQVSRGVAAQMRVWPNLAPVRSPAMQAFLKDAQFGLIARHAVRVQAMPGFRGRSKQMRQRQALERLNTELVQAKAAADITAEPPVLTPQQAHELGQYVLPPMHLARSTNEGGARRAMDEAPHRLKSSFYVGGQEQFYLEGQISYAIP